MAEYCVVFLQLCSFSSYSTENTWKIQHVEKK